VRFGPGGRGAQGNEPSEQTARIVMFSSAHEPAVAVYLDSDKIGVWTPGGADNAMLHRKDGDVEYYDGER
jgi:hypothetical protein